MSPETRDALARYAAGLDASRWRLDRNWTDLRARLVADEKAKDDRERDRPPRRAFRWLVAGLGLAAAALVIATLTQLGPATVHEDGHPGALMPYGTPEPAASRDCAKAEPSGHDDPPRVPTDRSAPSGVIDAIDTTPPLATPAAPARHDPPRRVARARKPSPSPVASIEGEVAVLRQARAAFRDRDYAGALARIDEHRRHYPAGALVEERMALRVRVLCRAGDTSGARRERDQFLAAHGDSPLAATVRHACESSPR
jgi:hypothetical protein